MPNGFWGCEKKENPAGGFSDVFRLCIIIFEWSIDESCMNRYNIEKPLIRQRVRLSDI